MALPTNLISHLSFVATLLLQNISRLERFWCCRCHCHVLYYCFFFFFNIERNAKTRVISQNVLNEGKGKIKQWQTRPSTTQQWQLTCVCVCVCVCAFAWVAAQWSPWHSNCHKLLNCPVFFFKTRQHLVGVNSGLLHLHLLLLQSALGVGSELSTDDLPPQNLGSKNKRRRRKKEHEAAVDNVRQTLSWLAPHWVWQGSLWLRWLSISCNCFSYIHGAPPPPFFYYLLNSHRPNHPPEHSSAAFCFNLAMLYFQVIYPSPPIFSALRDSPRPREVMRQCLLFVSPVSKQRRLLTALTQCVIIAWVH